MRFLTVFDRVLDRRRESAGPSSQPFRRSTRRSPSPSRHRRRIVNSSATESRYRPSSPLHVTVRQAVANRQFRADQPDPAPRRRQFEEPMPHDPPSSEAESSEFLILDEEVYE